MRWWYIPTIELLKTYWEIFENYYNNEMRIDLDIL